MVYVIDFCVFVEPPTGKVNNLGTSQRNDDQIQSGWSTIFVHFLLESSDYDANYLYLCLILGIIELLSKLFKGLMAA